MPLGGASRRTFLATLAGAVAAPLVVRSGVLMPVKALSQPAEIWDIRIGDTPIEHFAGVEITRRNPAFVAARFFAGMGFPVDLQEVRKLARLCAERVPCDLQHKPAGILAAGDA